MEPKGKPLLRGIFLTLGGLVLAYVAFKISQESINDDSSLFAFAVAFGSFFLIVGGRILSLPDNAERIFKKRYWLLLALVYVALTPTISTVGDGTARYPLMVAILAVLCSLRPLLSFLDEASDLLDPAELEDDYRPARSALEEGAYDISGIKPQSPVERPPSESPSFAGSRSPAEPPPLPPSPPAVSEPPPDLPPLPTSKTGR
ncbi:MAG: hypothetical protein AAF560_15075 [Acidobacteriota bacterium]